MEAPMDGNCKRSKSVQNDPKVSRTYYSSLYTSHLLETVRLFEMPVNWRMSATERGICIQ